MAKLFGYIAGSIKLIVVEWSLRPVTGDGVCEPLGKTKSEGCDIVAHRVRAGGVNQNIHSKKGSKIVLILPVSQLI